MSRHKRKFPKGMGDWRRRSTAHAKVWCDGGIWRYEAWDTTGKVVATDNTGSWRPIFDRAFEVVSAVQTVENVGHELVRDFDFLVDHARDC